MSRTATQHGDTAEIQRRLRIVRHLEPEQVAPYFAVERSQPTPSYGYNPNYLALTPPVAPTVIANAPALPVEPTPVPPEDKPATLSQIEALAKTLGIGSLAPQGSAEPPLTTETATTGISRKTWLLVGAAGVAVIAVTFFLLRK